MDKTPSITKILLILGAWLLAVALLIFLLFGYQGREKGNQETGENQVIWHSDSETVTLEEANQRAASKIQSWQADAQLAWAEATWRPDTDWKQVITPQVAWTLCYYSPSQQQVACVSISGEKVFWVPPVPLAEAPSTLQTFPPAYGLNVAWLSFRAAGGDTFIHSHPGCILDLRLQQEGDLMIWRVSALHQQKQLDIRVDAQTGTVIAP
ncbi:MAG: hypothetical protein JW981_05685 [Anaerolineae bacterium]|nr:hypothetical protein [Anaerolineae bacterium]